MRSLLDSGLRGTFDAFAKRAGVPERLASQTLRHLCLEQAAAVHGKDTTHLVPVWACLIGSVLPAACDACLTSRSGLPGGAVGGVFYSFLKA